MAGIICLSAVPSITLSQSSLTSIKPPLAAAFPAPQVQGRHVRVSWSASISTGSRLSMASDKRARRRGAVAVRAMDPKEEKDWEGIGKAAPGWNIAEEPRVYYFAIANAYTLMLGRTLLEEVLRDGIDQAAKEKRERDVWLVMDPAFLDDHPGLAGLRAQLPRPTAAIVTTNGNWVLGTVKQLLPQAVLGKFKAPTDAVPNPLKSNCNPADAVIGGGGVWH